MITTGIRELKNNLSRYLLEVKEGIDILITERGTPIARLVPEPQTKSFLRDLLAPLVVKGIAILPEKELDKNPSSPLKLKGKDLSQMIIDDRR